MMRSLAVLIHYIVTGLVLTALGYRLLLSGPLAPAGMEKSVDGFVIFTSIALNTGMAFAAAGVVAVMLVQARASYKSVLLVPAAVAGMIGIGMMLWFDGLSPAFPVTMAAAGAVCAVLARAFGLLRIEPGR